MKVFISADIEGVAGVVDVAQTVEPGPEYETGRRLLLGEVNAAIEGAVSGGATEVLVNDAHWKMTNLDPESLAAGAAYVSGRFKPLYMMQGLDATFDAAFFIGYHGAVGGGGSVLLATSKPTATGPVR